MEELTPLLNELAAQLNTTVEFLWQVMVRQAFISAIGQIVLYVLYGISVFVSIKYILKIWNSYKEQDHMLADDIPHLFGLIAIPFFLLLFTGMAIIEIPNLITKLMNPEYWALQQILEFIK